MRLDPERRKDIVTRDPRAPPFGFNTLTLSRTRPDAVATKLEERCPICCTRDPAWISSGPRKEAPRASG